MAWVVLQLVCNGYISCLNTWFGAGMWKRKLEAVEAVKFLWKRKHFDERGWKRKRKCWKGAGSGSNFFKIRLFQISNPATTVGVKCYNNNNNLESTTTAWYGMEWKVEWNGTEISVWNMEDDRMKWNGRFQEWNGRQSFILPYQFHTRFCVLYLQKNTYRCRVVINNVVTEVFNFNICG